MNFPATAAKLLRALVFACLLAGLVAQTKPVYPPVVSLPRGAVSRIPSPDGMWTLTFEIPDVNKVRTLWIQRHGSSERTLVRHFDRSLDISWSPDSHHFFVNDASGSTETLCYVYDPGTLGMTDIAAMLAKASSKANQYLGANHSYLEARHWVNSHQLLVSLEGYFDESPPTTPGFSGTYLVDLNGTVRTLRERYWG